jgi:TetR/AcrR family tetracycline transcriptional repressor
VGRRDHPTQRASRARINRRQIVEVAVEIARAGDVDRLTIRALANRLGVSPMALYRHVADKDDLLDDVVDTLLAERWRPRAAEDDWRGWLTEAADTLRRFLVEQPVALHVYLAHPVVSPAALARMEAMLAVLRRAGHDDASATLAYGALHTYTIGFAALEASRGPQRTGDGDAIARRLAGYTTPEQFATGLRYLLDGIGAAAPDPCSGP